MFLYSYVCRYLDLSTFIYAICNGIYFVFSYILLNQVNLYHFRFQSTVNEHVLSSVHPSLLLTFVINLFTISCENDRPKWSMHILVCLFSSALVEFTTAFIFIVCFLSLWITCSWSWYTCMYIYITYSFICFYIFLKLGSKI
jgi:hypothetical protein